MNRDSNSNLCENMSTAVDFGWPERPKDFPSLMTPIEAAMFLRLDQIGHTPKSAKRTLGYWRDRGELRATKYARHVWFLKEEIEHFLKVKTKD